MLIDEVDLYYIIVWFGMVCYAMVYCIILYVNVIYYITADCIIIQYIILCNELIKFITLNYANLLLLNNILLYYDMLRAIVLCYILLD